LLLLYSL